MQDQWKVSVQNRTLGKDAPVPGEKQMPSRPGKASNILLPVCPRYILAGSGNKAGNCLLVCHPELHIMVSKIESGHILDRRG